MRRFFFEPEHQKGALVSLSAEESKHASKVLRLPVGTKVELLDGMGKVFTGEIVQLGKYVQVRLLGEVESIHNTGKSLTVYQGILKGEKMETVVQKCTELGVDQMVPFHSSRCQGKLEAHKSVKKYDRWQRISLAACKQCYRSQPMVLKEPVVYHHLFPQIEENRDEPLRILFWEEENEVHLHDIEEIREASSVEMMLGPEGGFSEEEVVAARGLGWRSVSLGHRILRAETATLTAVSVVQYLLGRL